MMNITDPIVCPNAAWTKEKIYEQLEDQVEGEEFAEQISDEDALWWVEKESDIAFNAISYGEDFYGRNINELNVELIERTK